MSLSDDAPRARLCLLRKWPGHDNYGFNLHADKGKQGQYVGSIDQRSPAETGGLLRGDRIVEVNGVNIGCENHAQCVQRIRSIPEEVRLLVITQEGEEYYKKKNIVINSHMPNILSCESPATNPYLLGDIVLDKNFSLRHCHLILWPDFPGYGFHLQSLEGKPGQYIGAVDANSPASLGGLKENDRVLEVNQEDVANKTHKEVVDMIKSKQGSVSLIVVDSETEIYLTEKGISLSSKLPNVLEMKSPSYNPSRNDKSVNGDQTDGSTKQWDDTNTDGDHSGSDSTINSINSDDFQHQHQSKPSDLEFACSAKEARERMARKRNVKETGLSLKDKYEILQKL